MLATMLRIYQIVLIHSCITPLTFLMLDVGNLVPCISKQTAAESLAKWWLQFSRITLDTCLKHSWLECPAVWSRIDAIRRSTMLMPLVGAFSNQSTDGVDENISAISTKILLPFVPVLGDCDTHVRHSSTSCSTFLDLKFWLKKNINLLL